RSEAEHAARIEHLLWMIMNRPDWDGFSLHPTLSLMYLKDLGSHDELRAAWLQQAGILKDRADVAFHAAMFLALSEPQTAESLLRRAICLEPGNPLYRERLGTMYGYSVIAPGDLERLGVTDSPERAAFAQRAQAELAISEDWRVLQAAAIALHEPF